MTPLAERLVSGLRSAEATRPYQLDRPVFRSVAEAVVWLRDWCGEDGHTPWHKPWRGAESNDTERLKTLKRLLFARYRHRSDWIERGGR
jgi:hypothetical protein